MKKEKCTLCGSYSSSWTEFYSQDLKITLCPCCLMWSPDARVETVRDWLRKSKAAAVRAGVEITRGDAYA